MAKPKSFTRRQLSEILGEELAAVHDMTPDGEIIDQGQALVKIVMKKALGWKETIVKGREKTVIEHKSEAWAVQFIWDRLEGKAGLATPEVVEKVQVVETLKRLTAVKLNQIAEEAIAGATDAK